MRKNYKYIIAAIAILLIIIVYVIYQKRIEALDDGWKQPPP